jgi:serine/threonine-protein kinase
MASDDAVPAPSDISADETMASDIPRAPSPRISGSARTSSLEEVLSGAEDATVESGTQIGEYVIDGFVGSGAFGDVYRGVHPIIGKTAAIKVLKLRFSVDPTMVSRFVSEARAVNQIGHRAIIDIFAFGQLDDGRHYYIMELLEGVPLDGLIREMGRLSVWETFAILEPIGQALDAAHAAGIAHRDLKPDNIFLGREGDGWRPKLLDFGVAKLLGDQGQGHQTATGASVGTPAYMAPEQCLGVGVDHRADIYAFGVVAFQMLTGELPFKADSAFTVMTAHINQPPPKVSETCAEVPVPVSRVVARLLAKRPEDRPASLAEALAAFAEAAEQVGPRPGKGLGWWPWLGLGLVMVAGLAVWGLSRETPPAPLPPIQPTAVVPTAPVSAAPASVAPISAVPASAAPARPIRD